MFCNNFYSMLRTRYQDSGESPSDLEKHEKYDFVTVRVKAMKTNDPQR